MTPRERNDGDRHEPGGRATGPAGRSRSDVVTCFLQHREAVLLVRRSDRVGSYRGRWGAISGHVEGDPEGSAWREIREETGLTEAVTLLRSGRPFELDDAAEGRRWRVHPFLFEVATRDVRLDWEAQEGVWRAPTAILGLDTVPRLWTSYARVAPTARLLADDRERGAAALSLDALRVLRDAAGAWRAGEAAPGGASAPASGEAWTALAALARELRTVRPAMPVVRVRVDAAMADALRRRASGSAAVDAVEGASSARLDDALAAEEAVASAGARRLAGRRVATVSRSGTVERALLQASPPPARVVVAESRPGGEGVALARRLRDGGLSVALVPDAAVAWALEAERVEVLAVGADAVDPGRGVTNKIGTRAAAWAARRVGAAVVALCTGDKVAAGADSVEGEGEDEDDGADSVESAGAGEGAGAPPDSEDGLPWRAPWFERSPLSAFDALVSEDGPLDEGGLRALARRHADDARWGEAEPG